MRAIGLLYFRELREALRERNLVVYSLLIPLLLYPVMMWLAITGLTFVKGQSEKQTARIHIVDAPIDHAKLIVALDANEKIELQRDGSFDEARERLEADELDLIASFHAPAGDAAVLEGNFGIDVYYKGSADRSKEARERFEDEVREYRVTWLDREAASVGIADANWSLFDVERANEASGSEMGAFILGQLAPLTMIIMVAMGAMYPAVDATAGERERSTWETSLTLGVDRRHIIAAKYLYVATLASIAGLLNMAGISIALATTMTRLVGGDVDIDITIPWSAIPIVFVGVILLALLIGAGMMILAAFAKSFREGQSMVSPLFMVVILPVMIADLPEEAITLGYAAAPIVNVMILFKQAITASVRWDFVAVTVVSSLVAISACLKLATLLMRNEELVLGSFEGSAKDFMRSLLGRRGTKKVGGPG